MKRGRLFVRLTSLTLSTLALCACQSAPFIAPELALPETLAQRAGGMAVMNSKAPSTPSPIVRSFEQVLPIEELRELTDEALRGSSDLILAVERVELARAQHGGAQAALLPSLNATGAVTHQRTPGADPAANVRTEGASLGLAMPAWEIDLWGRLAARSEAARRDVLANAALADGVRTSIAAQVATLYLELLDLDQQLAITRRTLASRQQSLRMTSARFDAGISSILDVRQAESLHASAEQSMADLQRRLVQTENALSILLGRNPGAINRSQSLSALESLNGVGFALVAELGLPSDLLLRRPDIRAAEQVLRGAHAHVEAARKAFFPSLSLGTTLGLATPALAQLFNSGRYAWSLQPTVGLALFDGGRLQSGLELAQAQQRIALEQYRASIRQAFREVSDTLAALQALRLQREAGQRVVAANRERARIARTRYLSGIASYFEVLDAERQFFDSEVSLSQLTRNDYQALVQLYRVLGGAWRAGVP